MAAIPDLDWTPDSDDETKRGKGEFVLDELELPEEISIIFQKLNDTIVASNGHLTDVTELKTTTSTHATSIAANKTSIETADNAILANKDEIAKVDKVAQSAARGDLVIRTDNLNELEAQFSVTLASGRNELENPTLVFRVTQGKNQFQATVALQRLIREGEFFKRG
tara:strand:+ start:366 stop:866 length:501 start_codon:yes stop_codon:yes gene_type:complete